jgi:hypothetical protein
MAGLDATGSTASPKSYGDSGSSRRHRGETVQCLGAGTCRLGSLDGKVGSKECGVLVTFVEMVRSEHGRQNGNISVELDPHEPGDDGLSHELVPVDAAVDHQPGNHDGGISKAPGTRKRSTRPASKPSRTISSRNESRHRSTTAPCHSDWTKAMRVGASDHAAAPHWCVSCMLPPSDGAEKTRTSSSIPLTGSLSTSSGPRALGPTCRLGSILPVAGHDLGIHVPDLVSQLVDERIEFGGKAGIRQRHDSNGQ